MLNNIVGLKPSLGLISTAGVVPACRSLDCGAARLPLRGLRRPRGRGHLGAWRLARVRRASREADRV